ncbi:MAG: PTS glucose transporter subunit IIA [Lachnospiraceae bacterium]|nr:PTS glucose transporter subunit IIA [Lachnospiraceae bacterium]
MALDYHKCAEEIYSHLGGKENIISAAHCATRLRLVIADNSKIDAKALEEVEGVKGMFNSNGQLQLIIGTGTVNKVYDEFLAITGLTAASKEEVKAAAAAKQPLPKRMLKSLGDVFVPILPAIVASGLLMGVVEALGKAIPNFAETDWYAFLDMISNTAFAYLPVLVAISAARVFGGNLFLGAVVGLAMIHSNLINAWAVSGMDAAEIPRWHLLFFNVKTVGYQGHVIPVVIAVWFMCMVEKWLHKHVPEVIDLFVTPITTVFITTFLTFTIIGPIFSTAESYILTFAQWLITVGFGVGSLLMGGLYPVTVVMGLHHMYNVIEAGMLAGDGGINTWMPIATAANFAQFGACLAVGIKTKNAKTRSVAIPSALSAALGITEPAIFGVNLRYMKPFVCGIIGGAIGAMVSAWMHIGASAYGVTGIPGYLTINDPLKYTIILLISGGVAFILTTIVYKEEEKDAGASKKEETADLPKPENVVISCSAGEIVAPVVGKVVAQADIPDETFAAGVLGEGVGIEPEYGVVYAPYDGVISSVAESKHAIGITGPNDMELLIHVGVDTVSMNGDGFNCLVSEDEEVKKGQKLMEFDKAKIAAAGHPDVVVVLLTNSDDYEDVKLG